jgi:hypothetical protein
MLIALVIVVCILLLILGFLVPRLSTKPQRGVDATLSTGEPNSGKARVRSAGSPGLRSLRGDPPSWECESAGASG